MATKTSCWPTYFAERTEIDTLTNCWNWTLRRGHDGYGMCFVMRDTTVMAHRVSYITLVGAIPNGLTLDHLCRNRSCVNPEHLQPVTMRENTLRAPMSMATINANRVECINGHPFTAENTRIGSNRRACRACNRAAVARYKARRMAAAS